ncbi:hypothetical protein BC834DRAFT_879635 [Gloeopeniophorella convolvens]|nr:hypothetical protein BC834DRAFT_879635 [Gloeopeniophorella convolvens]
MTQKLPILTGCSAGATESFVVVPFELVKTKQAYSIRAREQRAESAARICRRLRRTVVNTTQ